MTQPTPVRFHDRPLGKICEEVVVAEGGIRWAYQSRLGRLFTRLVLARRLPSTLYGWYQDSGLSRGKIASFAETLDIDTDECERPLAEYRSFNDFFTRALKPDRRPIDPDPDHLISPADGRVLVWPAAAGDTIVPIKGASVSIDRLLGGPEVSAPFVGGSVVVIRLCPADYHRFHFPAAGTPGPARRIGGRLHSVNPIAMESGIPIFDRNQREVTVLDGTRFGRIAMVDVGAMFVGKVVQTYTPAEPVRRGDLKGYFTFGASTVVMLTEPGRVTLDEDLVAHSAEGLETRLLFGTRIGRAD